MRSDHPTTALIFDMDGTMVESMSHHAQSWLLFAQRHGLTIDLPDLMRRTNGRNGIECMRELFQCDLDEAKAQSLIAEKEHIYRGIFGPVFAEVAGFKAFYAQANAMKLKTGIGSAGDRHNIAFVMDQLMLPMPPLAIVGGDEGLAGKPDPAIFLEVASRLQAHPQGCIVFEDSPFGIEAARRAGMRAVAICTSQTPKQLAGPHVITAARHFRDLLEAHFLETLHVATA